VWSLRLLGVGLVVLGVALMGPLSTRGPAFRLRRVETQLPLEAFLTFRKWLARLIGLALVIGGVIYIVHPPPHLH
jgi:hypothetical protein